MWGSLRVQYKNIPILYPPKEDPFPREAKNSSFYKLYTQAKFKELGPKFKELGLVYLLLQFFYVCARNLGTWELGYLGTWELGNLGGRRLSSFWKKNFFYAKFFLTQSKLSARAYNSFIPSFALTPSFVFIFINYFFFSFIY